LGDRFRPMLSVRCLSVCLSVLSCPVCLSLCDVCALWPNGWTDQYETWHAGWPLPWPMCVRWGLSSSSPKGAQPPIFGPYLLRPNGCMDQDVTWYGCIGLIPGGLCVRWETQSPPQKGGRAPHFWPMFIVAKPLDGSRWHLARK